MTAAVEPCPCSSFAGVCTVGVATPARAAASTDSDPGVDDINSPTPSRGASKDAAAAAVLRYRRLFAGAWPFLVIVLVEIYDDWYTKFTSGYTCPAWYLTSAHSRAEEPPISRAESEILLRKASRAFFADLRDGIEYVVGRRKDFFAQPYHDEIRDAVCPVGYEYNFPVSGTTWRWEFSPSWSADYLAHSRDGVLKNGYLVSTSSSGASASSSSSTSAAAGPGKTAGGGATASGTRGAFPIPSSAAAGGAPPTSTANSISISLPALQEKDYARIDREYDPFGHFLFWIPTTLKRWINCYGYGTDPFFPDSHPMEQALCGYWLRPHTSCLDDCGMPSGHANVAYFYLFWALPYFWRSGLLQRHFNRGPMNATKAEDAIVLSRREITVTELTTTLLVQEEDNKIERHSRSGGGCEDGLANDVNKTQKIQIQMRSAGTSQKILFGGNFEDNSGRRGATTRSETTLPINPKAERARGDTTSAMKFALALLALSFLLVQPYVIVALGDHTAFQGIVGAVSGGLAGFAFYKIVLTDAVILDFVDSPIGRSLGFHDNYTIDIVKRKFGTNARRVALARHERDICCATVEAYWRAFSFSVALPRDFVN